MAITHVNTTSALSTGTSVNVNKPASTANGDIMIAFCIGNDTAMTCTGWTQAFTQGATATGNSFRMTILYRYVDGTEGAGPYTFSGGSGVPLGVIVSAYRGAASSSPFSIGSRTGSDSTSSEPYAISSLSFTGSGKAFALRACRFSGTSPNQPNIDGVNFSDSDGDTNYRAHVRPISSTGNTQYALGMFEYTAQVDNGDSRSASISHDGNAGENTATETDNLYAIFGLKMEGTPATGTLGMTTPAVTSTFDGERMIPEGVIGPTQIPAVVASMAGIASPPEGTLGPMSIPAIQADLAGQIIFGTVGPMSIPAVQASMTGTHVGGSAAMTIPAIVAEVVGGMEMFGPVDTLIPAVVVEFLAESRVFGEHVIRVEPDHRAFLVTDDDNGLIPIKRSKVTQL